MKKIIYLLMTILFFIPVMVNAAECDISKVYIESISVDKATGNVEELEDATAKDKKVNLNLRMSTKDDEILYKVVLKNDSEDDYEINKNSIKLSSDYIDYSLESDDNNIVKAKSTRTIYLRVKYKTEVDPSKFVNGEYQDEITMKVNLQSDDTPANPNTGEDLTILIFVLILLIGLAVLLFGKKKNNKLKVILLVLSLSLIIPFSVNALCKCEIELNSKVVISNVRKYKVQFLGCRQFDVKEFEYEYGMTWREYFNSQYYTEVVNNSTPDSDFLKTDDFEDGRRSVSFKTVDQCPEDDRECLGNTINDETVSLDDMIKSKDLVRYSVGNTLC